MDCDKPIYFNEAMNTRRAGFWEYLMARLFGKKSVGTDYNGTIVTCAMWRGKSYLIDAKNGEIDD